MVRLEYENKLYEVPDDHIVIVRRDDELVGTTASEAFGDSIFHMDIVPGVEEVGRITIK